MNAPLVDLALFRSTTAATVLRAAPNWRDRAVCTRDLAWLEQAVEQQLDDCRGCPVVRECIAHAIANEQTGVVQGGLAIGNQPLTSITMTDENNGHWVVSKEPRPW